MKHEKHNLHTLILVLKNQVCCNSNAAHFSKHVGF